MSARLAVCILLVAACRTEPEEPGIRAVEPAPEMETVPVTAEEVPHELENLGYEIADLEAYLAAVPSGWPSGPGADPATLLEQARRARDAAEALVAAGNSETAAESLTAAMIHVEQMKRALSLGEELGEEVEP